MRYTEREKEILNNWPTVTQQDLERMNDLFPHYLFFRRMNTLGPVTIDLRTSCCGHRETRAELLRTETPEHRTCWTTSSTRSHGPAPGAAAV